MYDLRPHMIILLAVGFCHASATRRYPPIVVQSRDFKGHSVRQSASCNTLFAEDVMNLPGYPTLLATAQKNWGDGSFNLVTNDPLEPDFPPALSCLQTNPITISLVTPNCTNSTQTLDGTTQSNGSVTAQVTEGTAATAVFTVTDESVLSGGSSTQLGFSIPNFPTGISETLSFSANLTNTLSYSSTSTANTQQSQTITSNGKKCQLEMSTETCNAVGTAEVVFVAQGTVWFEYNDPTDGHYKWNLDLETELSDVSQRSGSMSVQVQINSNTGVNYQQTCNSGSTATANLGLLFMIVAIHTIVFG
ncbi:hypothetical protein MSAN_02296900 [Mycena sanguinolenta]|uniref:Uncharacterized protein n=1 Tax=Mycena sanguinolenta TaxID=230812 RepID=A0A8H7CG58_9AGAR|nr:hypothetical protein MSAN_02296900 [Mycena sanguinolenta]